MVSPAHVANHLLGVSLDFTSAWSEKALAYGIHTFSDYALLRGALEANYLLMWLIGPADRTTRIRRMLEILFWELGKAEAFTSLAKAATHRPGWSIDHTNGRRELTVYLDELGQTEADYQRAEINFTEVSKAIASKLPGSQTLDALEAWAVCSAFSHGQFFTGKALSDIVERVGPDGDSAPIVEASDVSLLAVLRTLERSLKGVENSLNSYGFGSPTGASN